MRHNDLTFFTNEQNRTLHDRFNKILNSNTQFFDVLVGYFRTSGFFNMYDAMRAVEKIRVLVGLSVDSRTVDIINQAKDITFLKLSHKEAKNAFTSSVEEEFATSNDTSEIEKGVRIFIDWLKSGKLEMRMYTDAPIHAKVYIMRKNMSIAPDTYGSVITGSSNFSQAGLVNNLEFNVELKDSRDVEFALERFENLWSKSVDIKDNYIDTVQGKTWLRDDITPYELYLKTLYEFFKEEINQDKETLLDDLLPDEYMRLQYQLDAVVQAKKTLESYGGVFIADVVGLGKTYICALLARSLKKSRKLIVCPPVLIDYWERVLRDFDVVVKVVSLGKLNSIIESTEMEAFEYVFIDEAHRFRNQDTESFKQLHQICYNKKVVLISATPINNYSGDIANQIYLFQSKHNSTIIPNVKNLGGFFAKLEGNLKKMTKGTKEYSLQLQKNSEEIRDKLLRQIMIRRTRKEIVEYYYDDLKKQGLTFPKLGTPEKIVYTFSDEVDEVFKETMGVISKLDYARYKPLLYLKDNKKYASLLTSQRNMSGFMKSILVKRLESSFYAFNKTLHRFIDSYKRFIDMCKNGNVYISKKVNVYDLLDSGDESSLLEFIEEGKLQYFAIDAFNDLFVPSLERDVCMLERLKEHWMTILVDPKLEQFKKELKNNRVLKNNKIIIFTESKETAEYLGENLKEIFAERVIEFSGESSQYLKRAIEDSFNPKNKHKDTDKYDVLITTDVLSEGINLHRSNVLINYDLPWNPTRIMQRVGRINRVGTEFDILHVFNFFPTSQSNQHLSLRDRIIEKLQMFHDTLGDDFKYLSEDERVTSHKLYDELNKDLDDDDEGITPELAYLATIRQVRDNNITLFEKIKRLPLKAKAGKYSNIIKNTATVSFIRKGFLKMFFITANDAATCDTMELTFMEAIQHIKSNIEAEKVHIGEEYFEQLYKNKSAFDEKIKEEEELKPEKQRMTGNDAKLIKYLKAIARCKQFTDEQDAMIIKMRNLWEDGEIPMSLTKEILKSIMLMGNETDELKIFYTIYDMIPQRYFEGRTDNKRQMKGIKQVILSCFMKER